MRISYDADGVYSHTLCLIYILILKLANVTPLAICEYKEELYEMMRVQSLHDYRLRAESVGEKGDAAVKDIILAAGLLGSIGGFRSIGSYGEAKRREKLRFLTRESMQMRNLLSKCALPSTMPAATIATTTAAATSTHST